MITEEMRAAGWRECPTDEVRKAWEEKGGRWQVMQWLYGRLTAPYTEQAGDHGIMDCVRVGAWRPVNSTTWDYCSDGWGDAVKIERWLTEEDVEKYGSLWRWWSDGWNNTHVVSELAMAYVEDGDVKICAGWEAGWEADNFAPADYFTPVKSTG